jgi:hypothetical protein
MMTTETKPAEEDLATRLSGISAQLDEAEKSVAVAKSAQEAVAGLEMLGEVDEKEVRIAEEALAEANRHLAALGSAKKVLEGRAAAQANAEQQERIARWRKEADGAAKAQAGALGKIEQHARQLVAALEVLRAQGEVLGGLHHQLSLAQPETAQEVAEDKRSALAQLANVFAAKRGTIRNECAAAQYKIQAAGDGVDRALETDLVLGDQLVAEAGTRFSIARKSVLDYEVSALARLDQELHAAQQEAFLEHVSRAEVAGLGSLPASLEEVRASANLPVEVLALLITDQTARSLAGLAGFLPASSNAGMSVRAVPTSALEARQSESRLSEGVRVLRSLVGG